MNNPRQAVFSYNNVEWGYVIDTNKGVYLDSRTMSKQQYDKYYRTQTNLKRPHLNHRQNFQFQFEYYIGEKLIGLKQLQNLYQLERFFRLSSPSFFHRHAQQIFGKSVAIGLIAQNQKSGPNRTDEEKEKIANYGRNRIRNAVSLGLYPSINKIKGSQSVVNQATDILRSRYLSKNGTASAAPKTAQVHDSE